MKKLFAVILIVGIFLFISCGRDKSTNSTDPADDPPIVINLSYYWADSTEQGIHFLTYISYEAYSTDEDYEVYRVDLYLNGTLYDFHAFNGGGSQFSFNYYALENHIPLPMTFQARAYLNSDPVVSKWSESTYIEE